MITEKEREAVSGIESRSEFIERQAVVAEALSWLGTKFHNGARIKGVGVDCGELLIAVYSSTGMMPDYKPGHHSPQRHLHNPGGPEEYVEDVLKFSREVEKAAHGDFALFYVGRHYGHAAIVIDWPGRVIHAPGPSGKRGIQGCVQLGDAAREPMFRLGGSQFPPRFFSPWKT